MIRLHHWLLLTRFSQGMTSFLSPSLLITVPVDA